jgi:hypothetical protein
MSAGRWSKTPGTAFFDSNPRALSTRRSMRAIKRFSRSAGAAGPCAEDATALAEGAVAAVVAGATG